MLLKVAIQKKNLNMTMIMMKMIMMIANLLTFRNLKISQMLEKTLNATWKSLAPLKIKDTLKEYNYAVIYIDSKKNKKNVCWKSITKMVACRAGKYASNKIW